LATSDLISPRSEEVMNPALVRVIREFRPPTCGTRSGPGSGQSRCCNWGRLRDRDGISDLLRSLEQSANQGAWYQGLETSAET
jgi:hypothetical protein